MNSVGQKSLLTKTFRCNLIDNLTKLYVVPILENLLWSQRSPVKGRIKDHGIFPEQGKPTYGTLCIPIFP